MFNFNFIKNIIFFDFLLSYWKDIKIDFFEFLMKKSGNNVITLVISVSTNAKLSVLDFM